LELDLEDFYRRYAPMVLRRCRKLLRDPKEAEDALQDVFVALLRRRGRLDDRAPAALLLRVATNVCLNRLRSGKRRPEDASGDLLERIAATGPSDGRSTAHGMLARLFEGEGPLAASSQTIAVIHLHDGLTLEETAREVGLSVSAVRKRLRKLRGRLVELEAVS
jgi:RNA polymerase sigma factor (sigma-70 family)